MFNKKFLVTLTLVIAFVISCGKNDPNKPDTWIAKLENPKTKSEAIDKLAEIKAEAALDKLLEILKEDDKDLAPKALRAIIQIGKEDKITEAIKIGVKSKNRAVSTSSINAVKNLPQKSDAVLQIVVDAINSEDMFTQEAAIIAAGELKIKNAVDNLIKILENTTSTQNIILNKQAGISLGKIGDVKAIKPLVNALFIIKDEKGNKGSAFVTSRDALVTFGKPALDEIVKSLKGENEELKAFLKSNPKIKQSDVDYNLLVMIGEMGNEEQLPVLEKFIDHSDPGVRLQAQSCMGSLNMPKAVPMLMKRYALLKAQIPKEQDENKLPDLVKEVTNINRMLAMIATPEALKHVMKEALTGDVKIDGESFPDIRIDAAQSLSNFAGYEFYKDFQQLWAKEKDLDLKDTFKVVLTIMEVTNDCKEDAACYIKYLDRVKTKDDTFLRQKAAYALVRFNTPEVKKALYEKAMVDKDPGVRNAAEYTLSRIGTKEDIKDIDKVIEVCTKKSQLKASIALYTKLKTKLENK